MRILGYLNIINLISIFMKRLTAIYSAIFSLVFIQGCANISTNTISSNTAEAQAPSTEQLIRQPFISKLDQSQRNYYVYLPKGYEDNKDKQWPILFFLHGNGERGNGQDELDFATIHGPLSEAWVQKRDLPFIIITPQLPMFGQDKTVSYLQNRDKNIIPKRQAEGVPPRRKIGLPKDQIVRNPSTSDMSTMPPLLPMGWEQIEDDLLDMLAHTQTNYRTDPSRVYLTGLSYGGFGTWYMASKHPELFAAIAPIVGWGHPDLMAPIANSNLPVWAFAGGLDRAVPVKHFYAGIDTLKKLKQHIHKNSELRFTVHEDMGHDTWKRVYAGEDLYNWLLSKQNPHTHNHNPVKNEGK